MGITCFAVYALMFCSSAHGEVMVLDSDSVGSEESFTMLNVPAESAVTPLEQPLHLSSSGITSQEARRAIVRMFPDKQQKIKVSKASSDFARYDAEDLNNTGGAAERPSVDRQN